MNKQPKHFIGVDFTEGLFDAIAPYTVKEIEMWKQGFLSGLRAHDAYTKAIKREKPKNDNE